MAVGYFYYDVLSRFVILVGFYDAGNLEIWLEQVFIWGGGIGGEGRNRTYLSRESDSQRF